MHLTLVKQQELTTAHSMSSLPEPQRCIEYERRVGYIPPSNGEGPISLGPSILVPISAIQPGQATARHLQRALNCKTLTDVERTTGVVGETSKGPETD